MSVRTDIVNLLVNVGGDKAKDELNQLRKKAAELNSEMKELHKNSTEYKNKAKDLAVVNDQMASLRKTIGLTALSQKELVAELKRLQALKNVTTPQTKEFNELQQSIDKVSSRLWEVKNGVFGVAAIFKKLKDEIGGFGVGALAALGAQFIMGKISSIVDGAANLSDQLADLQRVTGMTSKETDNLNKSLKQIDTRTSNSGLRDIAITAGKLGVAKDDIASFTQEVDKLVVTLGDELGNADEITTQLGKILNVFDGKVTGENISHLGNAMVDLANAGVASGGFISDFTQRVAGIAKSSNLSLGSTVGLAAGFEELGLRSESSATALQKLLMTIAGDLPKAAKIAGMDVKEFNTLFSNAPQEALIKYGEGLVKNKASFAEITSSFKDAGEEGARVVQTLQVLGQKGEFLKEKIDLGNESIKSATGINEAFAIKNENLAATIAKMGKEFDRLMTSPGVTDFLKSAVNGVASLIKGLVELPKWLADNSKALLSFGLAFAALNLSSIAGLFSGLIGRIGMYIVSLNGATLATNLLNVASKALQIGYGLIAGITAALIVQVSKLESEERKYAQSITDSATKMRVTSEIRMKSLDLIKDEVANVQIAIAKLQSYNTTQSEKQSILKSLKEHSNGYLNDLTLENLATEKGNTLLRTYINSLYEKVRAQAAEQLMIEKEKKKIELMQKYGIENTDTNTIDDKKREINKQLGDEGMVQGYWNILMGNKSERKQSIEDLNEVIRLQKEEDQLLTKISAKNISNQTTTGSGISNNSSIGESKEEKAAQAKREREQQANENAAEKELRLQKELHEKLLALKEQYQAKAESADALELEKLDQQLKEHLAKAKGNHENELFAQEVYYLALHALIMKWKEREVKAVEDANNLMLESDRETAKKKLKQITKDGHRLGDEILKLAEHNTKLYEQKLARKKEQKEKEKEGQQAVEDAAYNLIGSFTDYLNERDQRNLNKELAGYDKRKEHFKQMLDQKRISQAQYDAEIAKLDDKAAKRKHEIAVKELNRQKLMSSMAAIMNTAEGVTKALTLIPPYSFIAAGLVGAAGLLQLAKINSQEVPVAERGMLIGGKRHSEGGTMINAEQGELILSRKFVANNPQLAQAALFSSQNLNGANIGMNWSNPTISTRKVLQTASTSTSNVQAGGSVSSDNEMKVLMSTFIAHQQITNSILAKFPTSLTASVSLQEVNNANELLGSIKKESGLKQ